MQKANNILKKQETNGYSVSFCKPIIQEATGKGKFVNSWEPDSGAVYLEEDALVISGSSRLSFIEKFLSIGPLGEILIKSFFLTIRHKKRRVPYISISKIVASTPPPHRSIFRRVEGSKYPIIHVLFKEPSKGQKLCAFVNNTDLPAFWNSCSIRLGTEKLEIRDEEAGIALSQPGYIRNPIPQMP